MQLELAASVMQEPTAKSWYQDFIHGPYMFTTKRSSGTNTCQSSCCKTGTLCPTRSPQCMGVTYSSPWIHLNIKLFLNSFLCYYQTAVPTNWSYSKCQCFSWLDGKCFSFFVCSSSCGYCIIHSRSTKSRFDLFFNLPTPISSSTWLYKIYREL